MLSRNRCLNPDNPDNWSGVYFFANHITENAVSMPVRAGKLVPLLMEFLDSGGIDRNVMRRSDVFINDRLMPRKDWLNAIVAEGDRVQVCARIRGGGGGKNVMQLIASVVVVAAAAAVGGYVAGPLLGKLSLTTGAWVATAFSGAMGAVAGAAVMIGGTLFMGALFKTKPPSLGSSEQSEQNFVIESTQNTSRLYESQEYVSGRTRVSPSYAAAYFSTFEGDTQYWHAAYQVSVGDVHVEPDSLRIGDTAIVNYADVQYWIFEGWKGEHLPYFDFKRREIQENAELKFANWWITRQTDAGVRKIILMIQFPSGLYWAKSKGGTTSRDALFQYRWRRKGESAWLGHVSATITEHKTSAFIRTFTIDLPASDPESTVYEYSIIREDEFNETQERYIGPSTLIGVQYWYDDVAIKYRAPHSKTLIIVRIRSDGQLNGAVSNFNCIAHSYGYVPQEDGSFVRRLSTNPAALAAHFMIDESRTRRPWPTERIDWRSVREHYAFCEKYGFSYSAVRTDGAKSGVVVNDILSAGLGWMVPGTRCSFAFDGLDEDYTDTLTPWTCWGFELRREYPVYPVHGLLVEFPNREKDWQMDEVTVYADGYGADNATEIVKWTPAGGNRGTSGVDNYENAYALARIKLAQIVQRPETLVCHTNWRSLDYHVGQRVAVAWDVYLVGSGQGNVLCYVDENGNPLQTGDPATLCAGIRINSFIEMTDGKTYVARDGEKKSEKTWTLGTIEGAHNTLFFQFPIPISTAPKLMVPVLVGEAGRDVMICTILAVTRNADFTAQVTLVPTKGAEILAAIAGPIPPFDSKITTSSYHQRGRPLPPVVTSVRSDETVLESLLGALVPRIGVAFAVTAVPGVTVAQVRAQYRIRGASVWVDGGAVDARANEIFIPGVEEGVAYEVRLAAVSDQGILSNWTAAFVETVIGRTTPPPPPISVRLDGNRMLWEMDEDAPIDIVGWEVWMSMDANGDFNQALNISRGIVTERTFDLTRHTGHARRVWVRTVDDLGLMSEPVSVAVNLGDVQVDNVVVDILEGAERKWPGTVTQGGIVVDRLVADAASGFWDGDDFWGRADFWGGGTTLSMVYETEMAIPDAVAGSFLSLVFDMPYGSIVSVEYRFISSGPFWDRKDFWGNDNFWNVGLEADWEPMPDKLAITGEEYIQIRVVTAGGTTAIIAEMRWVFDVEDEVDLASDLAVPPEGVRVPLTKTFRWIKNITFGQEYHAGTTAVRTVYVDKGVITDGVVAAGPLIYCRDMNNNNVSGIVDVTMQGAKGIFNG